jgi:hypothetical protein
MIVFLIGTIFGGAVAIIAMALSIPDWEDEDNDEE